MMMYENNDYVNNDVNTMIEISHTVYVNSHRRDIFYNSVLFTIIF